jgi:hypothetical protein
MKNAGTALADMQIHVKFKLSERRPWIRRCLILSEA